MMLDQLSLFDIPASRASDPDSSHIAERQLKDSGDMGKKRKMVYEALKGNGWLTARELSARSGLDHPTTHKRLPELEALGYVERKRNPIGEIHLRKCRISGRKCCVWRANG